MTSDREARFETETSARLRASRGGGPTCTLERAAFVRGASGARRLLRLLAASLLLSAACADTTTPGEVVHIQWEIDQAANGEQADFDTDTGYHVHLEEARLELAAAYLYAPASEQLSAVAWLESALVSKARAHGGLDAETGRRVLAELTEAVSVDALATSAIRVPEADAEAGAFDATKLQLSDGEIAHVRGRAERGDQSWSFRADVEPPEDVARFVEVVGLQGRLSEGATVHIRVEPREWLRQCEFASLTTDTDTDDAEDPSVDAPADDTEPILVAADSQVGRALSSGIRSPDAYGLYVEAEETADEM